MIQVLGTAEAGFGCVDSFGRHDDALEKEFVLYGHSTRFKVYSMYPLPLEPSFDGWVWCSEPLVRMVRPALSSTAMDSFVPTCLSWILRRISTTVP